MINGTNQVDFFQSQSTLNVDSRVDSYNPLFTILLHNSSREKMYDFFCVALNGYDLWFMRTDGYAVYRNF